MSGGSYAITHEMKISEKLRSLICSAESICVLTGAGISAESGVETFRGSNGLWSKLKPEELANFDAFMRNPDLVWEWYNYRKEIIHRVKPNPAHFALARLQAWVKKLTLVTQNIDNLHIRAGSKNVLEVHGNIENFTFCIHSYVSSFFTIVSNFFRIAASSISRLGLDWRGRRLIIEL